MESAVLTSFGGNLAAMALAGGLYFGFRMLKRTKCRSHTECCDVEMAKAETERDDRMILKILESLGKDGAAAFPLDSARRREDPAGHEGAAVRGDRTQVARHSRAPERHYFRGSPPRGDAARPDAEGAEV